MNAIAFIFRPVWVAALNFAHLMALLLAAGAAWAAPRRYRRLAAVMLLAALGWGVNVAVSLRMATLPVGGTPGTALAWAQFAGDLPVWAAVVVGLAAARRGASRGGA